VSFDLAVQIGQVAFLALNVVLGASTAPSGFAGSAAFWTQSGLRLSNAGWAGDVI
jgi:hypothetical protein